MAFYLTSRSQKLTRLSPFYLQIRLEGSEWSFPFSVDDEEIIDVIVCHIDGRRQSVRLDVHGHVDGSRFHGIFQLGSSRGPYRYVLI